jgi:hypothetical protein
MLKVVGSHLRANMVGYIALFVALGGTTVAATGDPFILGKPNSASSKTSLSAPISNKALQLTNTSTGAGATALGLNVASGHPPFTVNSGTKVANLNADKLDGNDSSAFVSGGGARYQNAIVGFPGDPFGGNLVTAPGVGSVRRTCTDSPLGVSFDYVNESGDIERVLEERPDGTLIPYDRLANGAATTATPTALARVVTYHVVFGGDGVGAGFGMATFTAVGQNALVTEGDECAVRATAHVTG